MQEPPVIQSARSPDWIERNWKWLVPVMVLVCTLGCAGFFVFVRGLLKTSDAYVQAVARAKADAVVVAALGTPIQEGYFFTGNVHVNGEKGSADFTIPISGPKGEATIIVVAAKADGAWQFSRLVVRLDKSGTKVDLLEKESKPPSGLAW